MRSTKRGKGQSIVKPGQTLHHFFKIAPQQQKLGTSQEIIVIDSDDEERLESTRPAKRRKIQTNDVDIDLTLEDWDDDQSFELDDWMLPDNVVSSVLALCDLDIASLYVRLLASVEPRQ
jgi:hypothetical protein